MPSMPHEALVELFRARPTMAADLLTDTFAVTLPAYAGVRVEDSSIGQLVPTVRQADLVLTFLKASGAPALAIIVEVQQSDPKQKPFAWPLYVAVLHARLRCEVHLVVVTTKKWIARKARQPVATFQPNSPFVPHVLGPDCMPCVTDAAVAERAPELALLSVLGCARERVAPVVDVALAAIVALARLDTKKAAIYHDLVHSALPPELRKVFEEAMTIKGYVYQSEFAKRYVAQGRAEGEAEGEAKGEARGEAKGQAEGEAKGRAEALLKVLGTRGLAATAEQRARILAVRDIALLDRWLEDCMRVTSVEQLLEITSA